MGTVSCVPFEASKSHGGITDWTTDEWIEHMTRGSNEHKFQHC